MTITDPFLNVMIDREALSDYGEHQDLLDN
jgi:hypothetical protein